MDNKKCLFGRLLGEMKKNKRMLVLLCLVMLLSRMALVAVPKVIEDLTDYLQSSIGMGNFRMSEVVSLCLIMAALYLFGSGADGFINKWMVKISQTIACSLRDRAACKMDKLPLAYLDGHSSGDVLSRVTSDLDNFSGVMETSMVAILGQAILLVCLLVMMCFTQIWLALIYMCVILIGIIALYVLSKVTRKEYENLNNTLGRINAEISDSMFNLLLLKSYGCEKEKQKIFDRKNAEYARSYERSRFLGGFLLPGGTLVSDVAYLLMCVSGGMMMIRGTLTLGEFAAFLFYGNMIQTPLITLAGNMTDVQNAISCATRFYEFLDAEEEPPESPDRELDPASIKGCVEFQHVSFGYRPEKLLMKDISFKAEPGMKIAIVGPSGAGKTTMINLLLRFYDINDGQITIDGIDERLFSKEKLRSCFGTVLQDSWIFAGTVEENIAFGRPGASHAEVVEAAEMANCTSFISKLPDGYETVISGENTLLSSGQKQLLCIARAFLARPSILILDEATSQVDTMTEAVIAESMEKMMEGKTSFVIAHRHYTIRNADKILYMQDGDIKEMGTHDELIALGGLYASMYAKMADANTVGA